MMSDVFNFVVQHWMLTSSALAVLLLIIAEEFKSYTTSKTMLSSQDVVIAINKGAVLYDIRSLTDYRSGYLQDALHKDEKDLLQKHNKLDNKSKIIVYCADGNKSASLVGKLKKQGLSNVFYLEGGINAWKTAGFILKKAT